MTLDQRHRFIIGKITEAYGLEESVVEKKILSEKQAVNGFFDANGPSSLRWYYQIPEERNKDGAYIAKGTRPQLFLSTQQNDHLTGKCVYFVRVNPKGVSEKMWDTDMVAGDILGPGALNALKALVSDLYLPILQEQSGWGKMSQEHTRDFLEGTGKFSAVLAEAVSCLENGIELRRPDERLAAFEPRPGSYSAAAADPEASKVAEECLNDWCQQVDALLVDRNVASPGEEPGPDTELEYWRQRMAKLNSLAEQLKGREARVVLGTCQVMHSSAAKRWKALELRVTDATNEAKDNVRYLTSLEPSLEVTYSGASPTKIKESLHGLLGACCTLYRIARFYHSTERMTTLLSKVTNQMMRACRDFILAPGKLWDQQRPQLIANMREAKDLADAYKSTFHAVRDEMARDSDDGKRLEVDERAVFLKFELFAKRIGKLCEMFMSIHQISGLEQHTHITGLEAVLRSFYQIVDDIKRKPYDLLDYTKNTFDRDYLEFNVNIHDLDSQMQAFVDASFDHITSTDHALALLAQFQEVLQRDTLQQQLEGKWMIIFQHYARDLEAVQATYEAQKHKPPLPRNAPPIAGNIMWARQLLQRIEVPMQRFAPNPALMSSKESKRVIRLYNRVAKALVEFEALWHAAWLKGIEAQKVGLSSPLLVRHPDSGQLLVSLDRDVMTLIREAKYMQQMGAAVPESARLLLLQEDKFKFYFAEISHVVREYEAVLGKVPPVFKPLLKPHLEDMDRKVAPGMFILSWTSMNIDGYLHRFKQGLARLEELVRRLTDLVTHRVETNLDAIRNMLLVDLPADRSFTYEEFNTCQQRHQKKAAEALAVRNEEVLRSIEDIIQLVRTYPRENPLCVLDEKEVDMFRAYYSGIMYKAILAATQRSFMAIKKRVGSHASTGIFFLERPFFDVNVELKVPNVSMNPTLEAIQEAINSTAKTILQGSKKLRCWGQPPGGPATYHDMIARDKEVVKSILLLTGSVEGIKNQVSEYIATFDKYKFLWTQDLQATYDAFMRTHPSLEAFEAELRKYNALEQEIAAIPTLHNIGSLSLETAPLKSSLRSEAASWKAQFAQNLHRQCAEDLKAFDNYIREATLRLSGKVEDLEDVRLTMAALDEVRDKEANIDTLISPIEDMYALLLRYEVRVPKEETALVSDLRYGWKKLRKLATDVSDNLARLQVGFKRELIKEVRAFVADAQAFRRDWDVGGPMVPGLDPVEAMDRLRKFQQMFEVRKRKWDNYSSGEELFGLTVTHFPELQQTEKEISMLDRLYTLYVTVITTIKGYGDYFWVDVVAKIDEMGEQVLQYQAQCRKLPKALRDWQAYLDCRDTIDNFLELLPLFQVCLLYWWFVNTVILYNQSAPQ